MTSARAIAVANTKAETQVTRLAEKELSKLKRKKQKNSDPEASDDEGNHQEDRKFWEKSTWTPPKNRNAAVETYLKPVETDAWRLTRSTKRKDNLLPSERQALKQLRARSNIIIKPADKGSATIAMSKESYLAEAYRQLSDTS